MHPSVRDMWREFIALRGPEGDAEPAFSYGHFCDNAADADACARLVLAGAKRATAPSLWGFLSSGERLPEVGDFHVVTDWAGEACCVIRTTDIEVLAFDAVAEEHARAEGEGDGSLAWWHRAHWAYYHRELEGSGYAPAPDMPVVFQRFECVHPVRR